MWIDSRLGYPLQALKGCNVNEAVHRPPLEARPISVAVGLAMKQSHVICGTSVCVTLVEAVVGLLGVCIMKNSKS